ALLRLVIVYAQEPGGRRLLAPAWNFLLIDRAVLCGGILCFRKNLDGKRPSRMTPRFRVTAGGLHRMVPGQISTRPYHAEFAHLLMGQRL
ncbi:MAG TPA: hypothetical protein VEO56_13590, partial [Bacteroidota bacterium]|nr:hypothetical protein [Bacteroidota bacterium]